MEISYELTQKDFTEAYSTHRNSKVVSKWARRIFITITGAITLLLLFGFIVKPSIQEAKNLAPFFGLVIVWIGILWALPWWAMRRQYLGQPGAKGPRTVLLDAAGAHWRWNGGSSDVEWQNYIRTVEGKNQILFYTSPACFNILPKRAISVPDVESLREVLRQNVQPTK